MRKDKECTRLTANVITLYVRDVMCKPVVETSNFRMYMYFIVRVETVPRNGLLSLCLLSDHSTYGNNSTYI
jgi:hypothetical protein